MPNTSQKLHALIIYTRAEGPCSRPRRRKSLEFYRHRRGHTVGQRLRLFLHPRHHEPRQFSSATADKTKQSSQIAWVSTRRVLWLLFLHTRNYYYYYYYYDYSIVRQKRLAYVYTRLHAHTSRRTWRYPRLGSLFYTLRPLTRLYIYNIHTHTRVWIRSLTRTLFTRTRPYTHIIIIILLCVWVQPSRRPRFPRNDTILASE